MKPLTVKVSEIHWAKYSDGTWAFNHYCDGHDREWIYDDDGYVVVSAANRIDGYCIHGQETKWKVKMLDLALDACNENFKLINERVDEINSIKSACKAISD